MGVAHAAYELQHEEQRLAGRELRRGEVHAARGLGDGDFAAVHAANERQGGEGERGRGELQATRPAGDEKLAGDHEQVQLHVCVIVVQQVDQLRQQVLLLLEESGGRLGGTSAVLARGTGTRLAVLQERRDGREKALHL